MSAVADRVVRPDQVGLDPKPVILSSHEQDSHSVSLVATPARLFVVRIKTFRQVARLADIKNDVLLEDEVNTSRGRERCVQRPDSEGVHGARGTSCVDLSLAHGFRYLGCAGWVPVFPLDSTERRLSFQTLTSGGCGNMVPSAKPRQIHLEEAGLCREEGTPSS